jgi:hypothetical protein
LASSLPIVVLPAPIKPIKKILFASATTIKNAYHMNDRHFKAKRVFCQRTLKFKLS